MITREIRYAATAWRYLDGIVCIYKPDFVNITSMKYILANNLSEDLCQLEQPEPSPYVSIVGETTKPMTVKIRESYADNVLMTGPMYNGGAIRLQEAIGLGDKTSGVCVLGIKGGTQTAKKLFASNLLRTYRVSGRLGIRTDNFFIDGKLKYKGKCDFIKRESLEGLLAMIQSTYQKRMFDLCGVNVQSQLAYEMASQGPIRVAPSPIPLIYAVRCTEFNSPDFTIEVNCVNENELFLINMIGEIGIRLRTEATCTAIRCIRYAFFNLENALLRKHWRVQHVIPNIVKCNQIIKENDVTDVPANLKALVADKQK